MGVPNVKKGARVNFVTAQNEVIDAKVISDGPNEWGQIDLAVSKHPRHGDLTVTLSPHDPDGKKHDSWHVPAAQPAPAATATTATK